MSFNQEYSPTDLLLRIEATLANILTPATDASLLMEAMRYSSLGGGKRIRPLLTIAAGGLNEACVESLITVGCAIELIHCYSLIHDDLPAMDDDDLRRGQPTCHKKYTEGIAILAGDALQTLAFEMLSAAELPIAATAKLKIIHLLASLAGVNGMVGGQTIDLISTGQQLDLVQLRQMHKMKTGGLIKAAVLAGYLCGAKFESPVYRSLERVADNLGLLFQITDDILDATADTATLGKTANKDFINQKATYVNMLGLNQARELAMLAYQEISKELAQFQNASDLSQLINLIYMRSN
jgi:farnesyl diphosphate synthase